MNLYLLGIKYTLFFIKHKRIEGLFWSVVEYREFGGVCPGEIPSSRLRTVLCEFFLGKRSYPSRIRGLIPLFSCHF
jgi:hypothetical protein